MGYPILLNVQNRHCVIVGGGKVGTRKARSLLPAGALVTVVSPQNETALDDLCQDPIVGARLTVVRETYEFGLLGQWKPFLVFAATNSPTVNYAVILEGHQMGSLVDSVDASAPIRDFSSMASFQRGLLTVAIATDGSSPALANYLKAKLEEFVGPEYAILSGWLAELRPQIQARIADERQRREFWQAILDSPILDYLHQEDLRQARALLDVLLEKLLNHGEG